MSPANPTIDLLMNRASVRRFADRPVEPDVLDTIIEAGTHAPTGGLQPYSVIVVEDRETKQHIFELDGVGQKQIVNAPANLVFCVDMRRNARWAELECAPFTATDSFEEWWIAMQDAVIFAQTVTVAAEAVGLGTVYIGTVYWYFDRLRELLELPTGVFPVVLLCVGYPRDERPQPRRKLPAAVVAHRGRYHDPTDDELLAAMTAKHQGIIQATAERIDEIATVSRKVGGVDVERRFRERVTERGHLSPVQFIYGIPYRADHAVEHNDRCLDALATAGFRWFERHSALPRTINATAASHKATP